MTEQKNIPELIRTARREQGLTQMDFAAALGVSRLTVINWESGAYDPDLHTLVRIICDAHPDEWSHNLAAELVSAVYHVCVTPMVEAEAGN